MNDERPNDAEGAPLLSPVQMLRGDTVGAHACSEIGEAAIAALILQIDRVYWNVNQEHWCNDAGRRGDPLIPGIHYQDYVWLDWDDPGAERKKIPNLMVEGFDIEVRWYKYPGRGTSINRAVSPDEWSAWLDRGMFFVYTHESRDDLYFDAEVNGVELAEWLGSPEDMLSFARWQRGPASPPGLTDRD